VSFYKTSSDMLEHAHGADEGGYDLLTFTLEPRDDLNDCGPTTFTILPSRRDTAYVGYGAYRLTITASIEQVLVNALFSRGTITAAQASEAARFVALYDQHAFEYEVLVADSYAEVMKLIMNL